MVLYLLSQLLIKVKMAAIIHFLKKVCIKINLIYDIFKGVFVYYKCYIMTGLMFLKELILIQQVHQKSVTFVTIGIS